MDINLCAYSMGLRFQCYHDLSDDVHFDDDDDDYGDYDDNHANLTMKMKHCQIDRPFCCYNLNFFYFLYFVEMHDFKNEKKFEFDENFQQRKSIYFDQISQ